MGGACDYPIWQSVLIRDVAARTYESAVGPGTPAADSRANVDA